MKSLSWLAAMLFLASLSIELRANAQDGGASVPTPAKQKLSRVLDELDTALRANDFTAAFSNMTDEAKESFVAQTLMNCLDIARYGEPKMASQFTAVCKRIGISEKLLPKALVTGEGISSEEEFEALNDKAQKNLLGALGSESQQIQALRVIFKAAESLPEDSTFFAFNPFQGECTEVTPTEAGLTAQTEGDFEPFFHAFVQTDSGWKWNDFDEEMTIAWLEQPLPLIENIRITGRSVEGYEIDLANLRGKTVLVDFWGTWCGPCVAELPTLKKIYRALHDKGFEILGVAQDDRRTLKSFLAKRNLPWANIVDEQGNRAAKFNINAFPTTLLINAAGEHYASDLSGTELLDEIINQLQLNPKDYIALRREIEKSESNMHMGNHGAGESDSDETGDAGVGMLPVGFEAADSNSDNSVSLAELKQYLDARLPDELPVAEIYKELDGDGNGSLSSDEFDRRHEVIEGVMGLGYLSGMQPPEDPGQDFVPFVNLRAPIDDRKIFGAVYHRYYETADAQKDWQEADLDSIPETCSLRLASAPSTTSLETVYRSSLILAGGGDQMFAAGAVAISEDGLALTNYHVAEALQSSKLFALRHDGESFPVVEMVAGNRDRDVAIIRIDGAGFTPVAVASSTPEPGDRLEMVHHSENRFFTYDRGYLMRHPIIGEHPWMEISMDYAPGGSGCGIFNERRELVGLVSTIQFGDGPSIAEPFISENQEDHATDLSADEAGYGGESYGGEFQDEALIMVKQAVSLDSIRSLFSESVAK
ncbi:MAG: redoxin domain-containing protein [Planctomycetota bacterium]